MQQSACHTIRAVNKMSSGVLNPENAQACFLTRDFLGGLAVNNLPANEEDASLIPGLGRYYFLGEIN